MKKRKYSILRRGMSLGVTALLLISLIAPLRVSAESILEPEGVSEPENNQPYEATELIENEKISEIFPDPEFAKYIASQVSQGNTEVILTPEMINALTSIDTYTGGIKDITGIGKLTSLEFVWITFSEIEIIPEEIGNLKELKSLELWGNQIHSLPNSLRDLTHLESLSLMDNKLTSLPDSLWELTQLTDLDLSYNKINTIPPTIEKLVNLENLGLVKTGLSEMPVEICRLDGLKTLDLTGNNISDIPSELFELIQLEELCLDNNKIKEIPIGLSKLIKLKNLKIGENDLGQIPSEIYTLNTLEYLNISEINITDIPENISGLTGLKGINISGNHLGEIPSPVFNLKNLRELSFDNIGLKELSTELFELSNLELLSMDYNQIFVLPESIGKLKKLRIISAEGNELTQLPEGFGDLEVLSIALLDGNQLTSLPKSFPNLHQLISLRVANNLLPTHYDQVLKDMGVLNVYEEEQSKLTIKNTAQVSYTIRDGDNISEIALGDMLEVVDQEGKIRPAVDSHHLVLEGFVNESGAPVELSHYFDQGIVKQEGKVFAKIRAQGEGIFSNTSDHALTEGVITLNFEKSETPIDTNNGSKVNPAVTATANTGDNTSIILWMICLLIAICALDALWFIKRKKMSYKK